MPYLECELPKYPCKSDMWDKLKAETRPIVIYGMGNGADKLIAHLEKLNIKFEDIFASDGFVRGHSFHGIRVKSFSEIKETYSDFVIALSFASNREEVIEMLKKIDKKYDMYIPDMPVAGEEYFDREFYNANYADIKRAYDIFADVDSKYAFASVINYKLSGKMKYLLSAYSDKEDIYSLINSYGKISSIVDGGAYNGDTLRDAIAYFPMISSAIAVEADKKNYKKLLKFSENVQRINIKAVNSALWSECKEGFFSSSGNRNSSVNSTVSYEYKDASIPFVTVDSLCAEDKIDYIKYDVEGAELEALIGSSQTISSHSPALLVSVYHRSADVFSLLLYLREKYNFYDFYLRRLPSVPAWELDLIALPKK